MANYSWPAGHFVFDFDFGLKFTKLNLAFKSLPDSQSNQMLFRQIDCLIEFYGKHPISRACGSKAFALNLAT